MTRVTNDPPWRLISVSPIGLTVVRVRSDADLDLVRALFCEYAAALGIDLAFQGFEAELAMLPDKYASPKAHCSSPATGAGRPSDAWPCGPSTGRALAR